MSLLPIFKILFKSLVSVYFHSADEVVVAGCGGGDDGDVGPVVHLQHVDDGLGLVGDCRRYLEGAEV